MKKKYNLKNIESIIYSIWEKKSNSLLNINSFKKTFSIIMPPPNITGNLHIGHALQQTIMDIIIRYQKMSGRNTLWIMGIDHAGISAQIIITNYIQNKFKLNFNKKTKFTFLKEALKWKYKYEKKINKQTKSLGSLVNWNKIHFSLDKNFSYAVKTAFLKFYKKKLIYKKNKIIYWDRKIKTVLSDLEVNFIKKKKKIWYIKFFLLNYINKKYIIVPINKLETILGITGILINTKSLKNKNLINDCVINPISNNIIPIIYKKKKKKKIIPIIPSYNLIDYEIAKKYKLNIINFINTNRNIKKKIKTYNYLGLKILNNLNLNININYSNNRITKSRIIRFLRKKKILIKVDKKKINLPFNFKTNSWVDIYFIKQWYLKTKILAENSINLIKQNKIIFYPSKYKKIFLIWMKNIKDWCISRQIWWGHKIPIWYDKNHNIYIGYNIKDIKTKYKINHLNLTQDKDVLDTWFSSSLWTFVSLGWPLQTKIVKIFHPINLVVSGFDIIFFWISRMIMMTSFLIKKKNEIQIPFKKIIITGLIRDEYGKKMSKSVGNVIDPIDIINGISLKNLIKKRTCNLLKPNIIKKIIKDTKKKFPHGIQYYGTDTLRFTLASLNTPNNNIKFDFNKLINNYFFCNKLWNLYRYIILILKEKKIKINIKKYLKKKNNLLLIDQWIIQKFNNLFLKFKKYINNFRFDFLCKKIFYFVKHQLCDWYLEFIKLKIKEKKKFDLSFLNLFFLSKKILILLHPVVPFITQYCWIKLKKFDKNMKYSILEEKILTLKYSIKKKNFFIIKIIKKIISYIRNKKLKFHVNNKTTTNLILFNIPYSLNIKIQMNIYLLKLIFIKNLYIYENIFWIKKIKNKINKFSKPEILVKNIYISFNFINY